jgi:hypothetical protein
VVLLFAVNGGLSAPGSGMFLHPSLLALANEHLTQPVSVIVQTSTPDSHL